MKIIPLFNFESYTIKTSKYNHILNGNIVRDFENQFADYVGAKNAISFSSATMAIMILLSKVNAVIKIPSIIPPVVVNAVVHAKRTERNPKGLYTFTDNISWVGGSYTLYKNDKFSIIDSAQRVDKNQFLNECKDNDLVIFSFYPTKPVGGCDGGMIVGNNNPLLDWLRIASTNGSILNSSSWEAEYKLFGWKAYLNSIQADIAKKSLSTLDARKLILKHIRDEYNKKLQLKNTSDHLYRINVKDNKKFIEYMKYNGVICGIHYKALHLDSFYGKNDCMLLNAEKESQQTVSIPFNAKLSNKNLKKIITLIENYDE